MEVTEPKPEALFPSGSRRELRYRETLRSLGGSLGDDSIDTIIHAVQEHCAADIADVVARYLIGQSIVDIITQTPFKTPEDIDQAIIYSTYQIVGKTDAPEAS